MTVYLAARDPRTPLMARLLAAAVALYALSPIDLIPDFIPILGYLDDLIIIPFGLWLAVLLVPREVMAEAAAKAAQRKLTSRERRIGMLIVVSLWAAALGLILFSVLGDGFLRDWHRDSSNR